MINCVCIDAFNNYVCGAAVAAALGNLNGVNWVSCSTNSFLLREIPVCDVAPPYLAFLCIIDGFCSCGITMTVLRGE